MALIPPAVPVMISVTATSIIVSELLGALEEAAPTLAIRVLILILTTIPLISLKTLC